MGKIFAIIVILFFLVGFPVFAKAENIAGSSATLSAGIEAKTVENISPQETYKKKIAIRKVLQKYGSPMADSADVFVDICMKYDIDCYLLPAIAGLESSFGKFIYPGSYNPFGWGGGYIMFNDWGSGIDKVANGLKNSYMSKGAVSIAQIGPIYSESPTWAVRVEKIKSLFEQEEQKNQLYFSLNEVK